LQTPCRPPIDPQEIILAGQQRLQRSLRTNTNQINKIKLQTPCRPPIDPQEIILAGQQRLQHSLRANTIGSIQ
jgi:type II secretory pathway predicted ATPase ExeA